jgi:hypothetical protein
MVAAVPAVVEACSESKATILATACRAHRSHAKPWRCLHSAAIAFALRCCVLTAVWLRTFAEDGDENVEQDKEPE